MMVSIASGPKKNPLREKGPLSRVKSPNFYKIIYIYILKVMHFFFSDVKYIINFIIGLQIAMLLITKKVI